MNRSSNIRIERASEADLPSIKLLLPELLAAMEDKGNFDVETATQSCREFLKEASHCLFVAKDSNSSVVGFVNFTTRRTVLHLAPSGLIDELLVSRRNRHRGVGRLLIQAVIEECRRLDCCEIEVSTEKSNISARRFYKACGFNEDAVLLELDLREWVTDK